MFADMAVPEALEQFRKQVDPQAQPGPNITVVLIGRPGAISPIIDTLDRRGLIPHEMNNQRQAYCLIGAPIHYTIKERTIANVFDLRLPECQDYVVEEFFKKDTAQLRKERRGGIHRFVESLPILRHPALGGASMAEDHGAILQALASFLRSRSECTRVSVGPVLTCSPRSGSANSSVGVDGAW